MNILTEKEIKEAWNMDESLSFIGNELKDARAIESAVLSKLAEQDVEPVAFTNEAQLGYVTSGQHPDIPLAMWSCNTSYAGASIKLYTEAKLIAAQQRTAEACAKVCNSRAAQHASETREDEADKCADSIRNGEWRKYL